MSINPSWVFHVDDVPIQSDTPTKYTSKSGSNLNLGYKLNQTYRSPKDATSFSSSVKTFGRSKSNRKRTIMSMSPSFSTCKYNDVDKSKFVAISSGTHIQLYRILMAALGKPGAPTGSTAKRRLHLVQQQPQTPPGAISVTSAARATAPERFRRPPPAPPPPPAPRTASGPDEGPPEWGPRPGPYRPKL